MSTICKSNNFLDMKRTIRMIITALFAAAGLFAALPALCQDDKKQLTMEERAAMEADRLGEMLNLEDWQIFYVDSTLQHDYAGLEREMKSLQGAKVGSVDLYVSVNDKWMDRIEASYRRFFTDEQWAKYLKNGAGRARKAREKRKAKAAKADALRSKNLEQ